MTFRFFAGGPRYEGALSSMNARFVPAVAPAMANLGATAIPGMNLSLAQRVWEWGGGIAGVRSGAWVVGWERAREIRGDGADSGDPAARPRER